MEQGQPALAQVLHGRSGQASVPIHSPVSARPHGWEGQLCRAQWQVYWYEQLGVGRSCAMPVAALGLEIGCVGRGLLLQAGLQAGEPVGVGLQATGLDFVILNRPLAWDSNTGHRPCGEKG